MEKSIEEYYLPSRSVQNWCCLFAWKISTSIASSSRRRLAKMMETARNLIYNFLLMFTEFVPTIRSILAATRSEDISGEKFLGNSSPTTTEFFFWLLLLPLLVHV